MRKLLILALFAGAACSSRSADVVRVGAIYPLGGLQAAGASGELRGVRLAAEMAGRETGRRIAITAVEANGSDGVPSTVASLASKGIRLIVGSHASSISHAVAVEASKRGMLFWETGAVGELPAMTASPEQIEKAQEAADKAQPFAGPYVFRVAPAGGSLGARAMAFVGDTLAPKLGRRVTSLRFAITYVDDEFGRAVAAGAAQELSSRGASAAISIPYDLRAFDAARLVRRIAAAKPDVFFVASYLTDGTAIRRETLAQRVPLQVNIGTSSSYCMREFGEALGKDAVGVFASDKPDPSIKRSGLAPAAQALLDRAQKEFARRYHSVMDEAALAGFSAAWALFDDVMTAAGGSTPQAVAAAALRTNLPDGSLPNGSGLRFASPGTPAAGQNLRAASVIWEWTKPGHRAVIWPDALATSPLVFHSGAGA